jgi:hypothetical protein
LQQVFAAGGVYGSSAFALDRAAPVLRARPLPYAKQRATVQAIVREVDTPEERNEAISELMRIVADNNRDRWLRTFAAEELGRLGAFQAQGLLGAVANQLCWIDTDRRLKWAAYLAQWQIRVASEPERQKKIELLKQALTDRFDGLIAWGVQAWTGSELANMGVKDAMPDIILSIRRREPPNRAEGLIQLHQAKIDIMNTYPTRLDALVYALASPDTNTRHEIKMWAISELGKLRTKESISALITYGIELQNAYYDENGKRVSPENDPLSRYAWRIYRTIVRTLEDSKLDTFAMKRMGLHPDRFFPTAP